MHYDNGIFFYPSPHSKNQTVSKGLLRACFRSGSCRPLHLILADVVYVRCMRPILRVYAEVYANAVHLTRFLFPSVRTP